MANFNPVAPKGHRLINRRQKTSNRLIQTDQINQNPIILSLKLKIAGCEACLFPFYGGEAKVKIVDIRPPLRKRQPNPMTGTAKAGERRVIQENRNKEDNYGSR